jgi:hypothetical protein
METVFAEATQTADASFLTATSVALTTSPTTGIPAFAGGLAFDFATATQTSTPILSSAGSPTPTNTNLPETVKPAAPVQWFGYPTWFIFYIICGFGFILVLFLLYLYFIVFGNGFSAKKTRSR